MAGTNELASVEGQLVGLPLAGPESFTVQQLAYLKRALGLDETTLYETTTGETTIQLSESLLNFDRVRFKIKTDQGYAFVERQISTSSNLVLGWSEGLGNAWWSSMLLAYNSTAHILTVTHVKMIASSFTSNTTTLSSQLDPSGQMNSIREIVGIHRIAGGN